MTTLPQFKPGRFAIPLVLSLSALLITGCQQEASDVVAAPVVQPALTEVITPGANDDLTFSGVIRASERAEISFRINGLLTNILVEEGDHVKQGQTLAVLDSRDAQTNLKSAELELQNTQDDYRRAKAIFEKSRAISKSDLDAITTRYNLSSNHVDEAKRQLEYTTLKAPFTGVIGRKLVDNHTQIQANAPVLILHDLNDLEVVINIPDQVMLSGLNQRSALAEISGIPEQTFSLSVRTYATEADPISQTYPIVLGFDDLKGFRVLPGMAVKVTPTITDNTTVTGSAISVPLTAIVPDNQGKQFVWIVGSDNKVVKRYIELGNLSKNRVFVNKNLSSGERVVIAGVSSLRDGMEVRPYSEQSYEQSSDEKTESASQKKAGA
ncbi:efflux RND transporter periplasmic adaptor subunit [uncultured Endozoicomonas sp.]|uniref:efflux RND transporter periplasmic adaptor subunit n=1 Tax=uncultured Endozoicomonas sp. TaxID=432652 RepID=UPI002627A91B|nr:efflux RND transporter periplasmic adaptor subunit [uncultured Endozoicomonas sp.]